MTIAPPPSTQEFSSIPVPQGQSALESRLDRLWETAKTKLPLENKASKTIDEYVKEYFRRCYPKSLDMRRISLSQIKRRKNDEIQRFIEYLKNRSSPSAQGEAPEESYLKRLPPFLATELMGYYNGNFSLFHAEGSLSNDEIRPIDIWEHSINVRYRSIKKFRAKFLKNIRAYQTSLLDLIQKLLGAWHHQIAAFGYEERAGSKQNILNIKMERAAKRWIIWNDLRIFLEGQQIKQDIQLLEQLSQKPLDQALCLFSEAEIVEMLQRINCFTRAEAINATVEKVLRNPEWNMIAKQYESVLAMQSINGIACYYDRCSFLGKPLFTPEQKEIWQKIFDKVQTEDIPLLAFRLKSLPTPLLNLLAPYAAFIKKCNTITAIAAVSNLNILANSNPRLLFNQISPCPFKALPKAIQNLDVPCAIKVVRTLKEYQNAPREIIQKIAADCYYPLMILNKYSESIWIKSAQTEIQQLLWMAKNDFEMKKFFARIASNDGSD